MICTLCCEEIGLVHINAKGVSGLWACRKHLATKPSAFLEKLP
jgi:hypothetical protein